MTANTDKGNLPLLKKSLKTIKILRSHLDERNKAPIAIVGMACRFPGGCDTPEAFWNMLKKGGDAISDIPEQRWRPEDFFDSNPDTPGKMYTNKASFLKEDVGKFDTGFFEISPREAVELDPQQRLLLEVGWEALEGAGLMNEDIKGSRTGVFVGITGSEYGMLPRNPESINPYSVTGSVPNIAAGRISYFMGLHGPSISVDTACSSSLVSINLACESLRRNECDMALTGGVGMLLSPYTFVSLSKIRALSPDGKCKTFDKFGDGYGRGEGCGMVVLKKLSSAQKDGDNILAVINGSSVNQDGPSSGLTVPNGLAQKELYLTALKNSGINSYDISYIEVHGTGTSLGDPIEMRGISEVYGKDRSEENPLLIGSVKANIGHLEAAAGIAGLIKTILCLQHEAVPQQIHIKELNPQINLEKIPGIIPKNLTPWRQNGVPRVAGISSFGFSGTNAHLIVSGAPVRKDKTAIFDRPQHILCLSAKNEAALNELAERYSAHIEANPEQEIANICYTANTGRIHFSKKAAFVAGNNSELIRQLNGFRADNTKNNLQIASETVKPTTQKIVFLFSGRSTEPVDKVKLLYETQPAFKNALDVCNRLFKSHQGNLHVDTFEGEVNFKSESWLFSVEYALARMWMSWGIMPSAVLGEKTGEYVAATISGIMSLETSVKLVAQIEQILRKRTLSRENDGPVFQNLLSDTTFRSPQIRFISGIPGTDKKEFVTPAYWMKQIFSSSDFERGLTSLYEQGYCQFLTTGSSLSDKAKDCLSKQDIRLFHSIASDDPWDSLLQSIATLYCLGHSVDWHGFDKDYHRKKHVLPTYPFQRKNYWIEKIPFSPEIKLNDVKADSEPYGMLKGNRIDSPLQMKMFKYRLSPDILPEIKDNHNVLHVGYYQEMLYSAVSSIYESFVIKEMNFYAAMVFTGGKDIHLIINEEENEEIKFQFFSTDGSENWTLHVDGIFLSSQTAGLPQITQQDREQIQARCISEQSGEQFYMELTKRGYKLGESVKWIDKIWYTKNEVLARFRLPRESEKGSDYRIQLHPGILDTCAQAYFPAFEHINATSRFMMVKWDTYKFDYKKIQGELWCHVVLKDGLSKQGFVRGQFHLFDNNGSSIAFAKECHMSEISKEREEALKQAMKDAENRLEGPGDEELIKELANASSEEKIGIMERYLTEKTASGLGLPVSDIDINEPLRNLGLDSLIGLELKSGIEKDLTMDVPVEILLQGPSIREFAKEMTRLFSSVKGSLQSNIVENVKHEIDKTDKKLWFTGRKIVPEAKVRMYCIPYGGGGSSLYKNWSKKFPDYVEICPIQLPGRENRIKENTFDNITDVVDCLKNVMASELDRPYVLYGHSMGALIAYRLAHELSKNTDRKPSHLFLGAYSSPFNSPNPFLDKVIAQFQKLGFKGIPTLGSMDSNDISKIKQVIKQGFSLPEIDISNKGNEEIINMFLPMIISDLKIVESYSTINADVIDLPVTAFHGENDDRVSHDEMDAWRKLTNASFNMHVIPGDHFFLKEDQDEDTLIDLISAEIGKYII